MRANRDAYLGWVHGAPLDHKVMHLLKDAGLASAAINVQVDARAASYAKPLLDAFGSGALQGPALALSMI